MSYEQRLTPQIRNLFTALVKEQPILYNDVDRSQEAKDARNRIWNSIGQRIGIRGKWIFYVLIKECNFNFVVFISCLGEVCKVKFTTMKNNYFNSLRKGFVNDTLKERLGFLDEVCVV